MESKRVATFYLPVTRRKRRKVATDFLGRPVAKIGRTLDNDPRTRGDEPKTVAEATLATPLPSVRIRLRPLTAIGVPTCHPMGRLNDPP